MNHWLAQFILHVSRTSRYWPVRALTHKAFDRLGAERFAVTGHEGVTIDAMRIASADRGDKLPVVFAHGWLETKEFHLREARLLTSHGHDVIMLDLRRHGRSTGHCVTFGVKEKHDVAAVIDEAQRRGWVGPRVITMGYSLGAATMLQHAAIDRRVAAVIAMAPFNRFAEAIRSFRKAHRAPISDRWLLNGFEKACRDYGFELAEASAIDAVANLHVPALFIVGTRDGLLPDQQHTRTLVEAKTNGHCQYVQIPGAGHVTLVLRRWPKMHEAIVEFCAEIPTGE